MNQCSEQVVDEFVMPNEENLKNLGTGCFVRVAYDSDNVWVEVTSVKGRKITGQVHAELNESSDSASCSSIAANSIVELHPESINALGCDRYCYCD